MSGGGIIIQRAQVLLTAATDPCIYACISSEDKSCVDDIEAKAPDQRTKADVIYLADLIKRTCHY